MDFAVANSGTHSIIIFLSNADGTFANQQTYSTGDQSSPYSIVVDDFNNDNHLDIAAANYGTNSIGIFVGYGNGTYASQNIFSTRSSRPLFITSGDFNNDNRPDIATVNNGTNTIGIHLGCGDGSFQTPTSYFTGYDTLPSSLAVGDFNKDETLDIVVARYGTNDISILLGYGNGSFGNQKTYATAINSNPSSVAAGDFTGDNQLDIVVANHGNGNGNIGLLLGYGNGTFAAQRIYSTSSYSRPQYITTGDFDNDNHLDVVAVDSDNNQIHILLGYGNGTFALLTTYDGISGSEPFSVAVADFNKDNRSDIVVVNYGTNNVLVLSGYFRRLSARQKNYFLGRESSPTAVAVSDLNNNKYLDMVVVDNIGSGIFMMIDYINGTFMKNTTYSNVNRSISQNIYIGDINNDNQMDIVTADPDSDTIGVLLGQGNGTFANVMTYSTGVRSWPFAVVYGDVNDDNRTDIISVNKGSSSVGVFLGNGNGTFADVVTYSTGTGSRPSSLTIGNVNSNNQLDIVTANNNVDSVGVLLGFGNGTFVLTMTYSTGKGSTPFAIALADLNSDTHLDIAVANTNSNNVGVFLGYGNGTLDDKQRIRRALALNHT
jgi:hypothetical protein